MDFSDLYKSTAAKFSPNGAFIAIALLHRVVIRDAASLQIIHVFSATDNIGHLVWSPDSTLIAAASFKKAFVQVWKLDDIDWHARISLSSPFGLVNYVWTPDSRHIMTFSELHVSLFELMMFILPITLEFILSR